MNALQTTPTRAWDVAGTVHLVGAPPRLTGRVTIANHGAEKLKVKTLDLRLKPGLKASTPRSFVVQLSARVAPGAVSSFVAQAEVDDVMPAGLYEAEIDVGNESRPAVLHVLERREISLTPVLFELSGAAGAKLKHPVVIANIGNVAVTLPRVVLAGMGEQGALHGLFHVAMSQAGGKGHVAALDAYAGLLANAEVDPVKVTLGDAAGATLAPGESRAVEFGFELPARLARHRIYRGTFVVGKTRAVVEVTTENGAASPSSPRRGRK